MFDDLSVYHRERMVYMNYYDLAVARKSVRSFGNKKIPDKIRQEIEDYGKHCECLTPGTAVEWRFFDGDILEQLSGCAGYHGFMVEAPCYMVLLTEEKEHCLENAGFAGEDMVLKLVELGLGSCWITILDGEKLKEQLGIISDKQPAALIAYGYEKPELGTLRIDIKSPSNIHLKQRSGLIAPKLYIEDAVYEGAWGQPSQIDLWPRNSNLYRALIAACCAPTALNRQPFRFIMDGHQIYLVILKDEMTTQENEGLNTGIVMHHFAMVMTRQSGLHGTWNLQPEKKDLGLPEGTYVAGSFEI